MPRTKESVVKKLKTAEMEMNSLFISKAVVIRLFGIYGGSRAKAEQVYGAMSEGYVNYLATHGLVDPGMGGIPRAFALDYLALYGITPENIAKDLKSREAEEGKIVDTNKED